jgi:large subunit ribosomal protein L7Ae
MANMLEAVELARSTGKIKKGANEVTKAVEKGKAKHVVIAEDANPKEIIMHIPLLCKEKGIPCHTAGTKEELGAAAGLKVGTVAVAILAEGEAKQMLGKEE